MSNNITPPPELLDKWDNLPLSTQEIFVIAAQWGADQELEECCEWLGSSGYAGTCFTLRAVRRPQPLSLKEQALKALGDAVVRGDNFAVSSAIPAIRRALEALPE